MPSTRIAHRQAGLSKVVLLLLIILIFVLIGSGTAAALYFAGIFGSPASGSPAAGEVAAEAKPKPLKPAIYVPLDPPLVVNFERNGRMGFLQATLQVMTREQAVQEAISRHMPVIRNNLLLLLSAKTYADVASREGKEQLRQEALAEINRVLGEQQVEGLADDLYFTGFVMQ
jgi:flagellar FliL protein